MSSPKEKASVVNVSSGESGMLDALRLAEGRLLMLLPAELPDSDHPNATHYVIERVRAAIYRHLTKDDFCALFKAELLRLGGKTFEDGSSVAEYADETGPTYWDDVDQRLEGPLNCAEADYSYWGEE